MKQKVLLRVILPANGQTYEFRVPLGITVDEGASLISSILASQERTRYEASDECDLMYVHGDEAGELLDPEVTFGALYAEDRLVDGSSLVLV